MNYNIYAIIIDEQIINLIVAENIFVAKEIAATYDKEKADAVECTAYKCSIGDYYIDGKFYYKDKETEILDTSVNMMIDSHTHNISTLNNEISIIQNVCNTLESSITKLAENKLYIEEALCEISLLISSLYSETTVTETQNKEEE